MHSKPTLHYIIIAREIDRGQITYLNNTEELYGHQG
jgi:hypothetical protein